MVERMFGPGNRLSSPAVMIRASMRQGADGAWVGLPEGGPEIRAGTREDCLRGLEESVRSDGPVTMVVEVLPALAGVAEAAGVLGWDKRRVVTYASRGRFPEPVQWLASGRVWLRDDVEAFAAAFHGRRLRRRTGAGGLPGER
jgi:hypothetical protein